MESLAAAANQLREILATAPAKLDQIAAPDQPVLDLWSRKQILGHLLDSAANNHHRFVRGQIEPELSMPGYVQNAWVETQGYHDRPWKDMVAFWAAYNRHLLHLMDTTPQSKLATPCRIGSDQPVTLEFLMKDYVRHLQHHLRQVIGE